MNPLTFEPYAELRERTNDFRRACEAFAAKQKPKFEGN